MRQPRIDWSPTGAHPSPLVDRDDLRADLRDDLLGFLEREDSSSSGLWAVIGDKGIGKTIFTRAVLDEVRAERSSTAVIATIDCRRRRTWREVLSQLCWALVNELREIKTIKSEAVHTALLAEAQLLEDLAKLDKAERQTFHERALSYRAGLEAELPTKLLSVLRADLGLELGIEEKRIRSLSGSRIFDEDRLNRAICALCNDIREAGLRVVIYLDNVDELDHEYHDESARIRVRKDAEGLLRLAESPVALVVNMRTYFSRVLPRQMPIPPWRLKPLPASELLAILDKRNRQESRAVRDSFGTLEARQAVIDLARLAPTPLAFLTWVHVLQRWNCLSLAKLEEGFSLYVEAMCSTIEKRRIVRVMETFDSPTVAVGRERVLAACEGSESLLRKLEDLQVVLPEDFWAPEHYTLDPMFQTLHQRIVGSEA